MIAISRLCPTGELPIEMVPASATAQLPGNHRPPWNRAAHATRRLLAHRALVDISLGLGMWLRTVLASLLCLLHLLGCHSSAGRCASVLLPTAIRWVTC